MAKAKKVTKSMAKKSVKPTESMMSPIMDRMSRVLPHSKMQQTMMDEKAHVGKMATIAKNLKKGKSKGY